MSDDRRRLFVVEDQRLIAADLESTLRKMGYDVVGNVASGEEASVRAIETRPDLILMDVRLQGAMDGIAAAAAIRERIDVAVVYLTAYADEQTLGRAKDTTPYGYLIKPFNERELRATIEMALSKHDTEKRLAAEIERRKAAEEFRVLVESVQEYAIFKSDAQGRVVTWNKGAERIWGYRAEEVIGRGVAMFYSRDEIERGQPARDLDDAARDGSLAVESWRVRKDGSRFWGRIVITALRDESNKLVGFARVAHDLTSRKRREEAQQLLDRATIALTSNLDLAQTLRRAARVAIPALADACILDLADERGRLSHAAVAHKNPAQEEALREAARANGDAPLSHCAEKVFRDCSSETYPKIHVTQWEPRPLGDEYPAIVRQLATLSFLCVPVRYRGRCQGALTLLRGSPPRRYDAEDLAAVEELARRIGLAIDNALLFEEAQVAIRARDEFMLIASHELRTPLTPLQLQLGTMSRCLERVGVHNEKIEARLEMALRQTKRLARLVETMLDVTRITTGKLELFVEEFDLGQAVKDLADELRQEAEQAHCALRVHLDGNLVGCWDKLRIEQVLSNLLSNAFKYAPGGEIDIEARGSNGSVSLRVIDHGAGIEKEKLEHIFGRFERAVSTRHYGGFGVGLYVAREVASAHGGTLNATSDPGTGATFTLTLPRVTARKRSRSS